MVPRRRRPQRRSPPRQLTFILFLTFTDMAATMQTAFVGQRLGSNAQPALRTRAAVRVAPVRKSLVVRAEKVSAHMWTAPAAHLCGMARPTTA